MSPRTLVVAAAAAVLALGGAHLAGAQSRPAPKPAPRAPEKTTDKTPPAAQTPPKPGQRSSSPIVIDADQMQASKKDGIVIFQGNVVAKQDNSTQTADRMEVYLDDKGERVVRIVSTGNVKIVTEDCRTGTARRAEYYDDEQRLLLIGDAKVWQEENVVTGEEITIWLAEDRSVVKGGSRERVKSVFYPKREESKTDGSQTTVKKEEKRTGSCG